MKPKKVRKVRAWAWVDDGNNLIYWGGDYLIGPEEYCTLYSPENDGDKCVPIEIILPTKRGIKSK